MMQWTSALDSVPGISSKSDIVVLDSFATVALSFCCCTGPVMMTVNNNMLFILTFMCRRSFVVFSVFVGV